MNFRTSYVLIAVLAAIGTLLISPALAAQTVGMELSLTAAGGSTTISVTGTTSITNEDITIVVTSPNGNIVTIDQVSPSSDGSFMTEIQTNSQLWKQDGFYTVTAQQGGVLAYKDSVQVDIADGVIVPEFGTIAVLILAVAIISIIVVSTKTRLNVLPKY